MESARARVHPFVGYTGALIIWAVAFVLGNLLGRIIASLQGWENFSYDRPGGVFYAAVSAGLGAYLALIASRRWLGDARFARFWLAVFVLLSTGLLIALIAFSIHQGSTVFLAWNTLATAVGVAVTEAIRRIPDKDLD